MRRLANSARNSNFEIMRIAAMLAIIGHHLIKVGALNNYAPNPPTDILLATPLVNRLVASFFLPSGRLGVALFFMLSGFFLCDASSVSIGKVVKTVVVYGWMFAMAGICLKVAGFSADTFAIKSFMNPVSGNVWWFATAYVSLLLVVPPLNSILRHLNALGLVAVDLFVYFFWMMPRGFFYFGIPIAVFYYTWGVLCRRYLPGVGPRPWIWLAAGGLLWIVSVAAVSEPMVAPGKGHSIHEPSDLAVAAVALCIFQYFRTLPRREIPWINAVASASFGVYLLHDHPMVRPLLWHDWLHVEDRMFPSPTFPLQVCFAIITIFALCATIDVLQRHLVALLFARFARCLFPCATRWFWSRPIR